MAVAIALGGVGVALSGCFLPTKATVIPKNDQGAEVTEAEISVDGQPVGQGTTTIRTDSSSKSITVDAQPEYYPKTFNLAAKAKGPIEVSLVRDRIYALTIEDSNKVVNRWLTLNISERAMSSWWSVIINAISSQDLEMELMDDQSGFIRTAWKERRFGKTGLRRRFVGNKVSTEPLTWRLKYQVQRTSNGRDWLEYDRGVKEEFDVIAEIRARVN